jgi:hypothetical protein
MRRLPVRLPPLVSKDTKLCDEAPDRAEAHAFWSEARSGLLAAAVARASTRARLSLLMYRFTERAGGPSPQTVERLAGSGDRAFGVTRPAAELAATGYVVREADGSLFIGPDEVVLADETFQATHCFSFARKPRAGDTLVQIAFRPTKDRRHADVEGTLTLRNNPLELLSVEFRYTGLSGQETRARPGGAIQFSLMPIGVSMVSKWSIRAVAVGAPRGIASFEATRASSVPDGVETVVQETGGVIERMEWPGLAPWVAALPTVSGKTSARGGETTALVASISNTPYRSAVDSLGRFTFLNVVPGRYMVGIEDTLLTAVGLRNRRTTQVIVKDAVTTVDLEVRPRRQLIEDACREDVRYNPMVRKVDGKGAIFAKFGVVSDTAFVPFTVVVEPSRDSASGTTDARGAFRVCNLPVPSTITIKSTSPYGVVEERIELRADSAIAFRRLIPRPSPPSP